ncbi:MAG: sugar ABC transporter substrate-binding protein [Lachnospiraceae bacterium]|jgi:ABC-type sugar transport system substrate-binding protein|nr:sugar ABC transporter substrate-binding protein [Lachnospiraceae bacterium]MCI9251081.1 sugar ABC transporter substrate-binding protein [Lachnospiraceae bacterium]MCI9384123.1 sugar ABC transporter substrate-binding protein [Lachnospiraceae bacterium]
MKKRIALLLAAVMVLGLAACGGKTEEPAASEPVQTEEAPEAEASGEETPAAEPAGDGSLAKVAFITQSLANPSQAYAWKLIQQYAADYGFEVTVFDEDYDAQNGVAAIGTCVSQGYVGIMINPTDPSAMIPAIQEAREAGVFVGIFSSELPEGFASTEYRDFACATNDYMCGEEAAKALMEAFPDGCKVVEVGGQSGHSAQILRHDGFFDTIDTAKVEVLDTKDCEAWATEDAMAIMEDFIVKHGEDIQAVFCHWDNGATGVIEALKAAEMNDVYVIGVDGCGAGYDQVKDGTQALCIGQSYQNMTTSSFECIQKLMNGETLPDEGVVYAPVDIVTKDNVETLPYPEW